MCFGHALAWHRRVFLCIGVVQHARHAIQELPVSTLEQSAVALGTAFGYVGMLIFIASMWVFPIPFTLVVGVAPCSSIFATLFAIAVGRKSFRNISMLRERFVDFLGVISVQGVLMVLYPSLSALFVILGSRMKLIFVPIIPLVKTTFKILAARLSVHWEDLIPVTTVFTVDAFNALYVASFMQNSGSAITVGLILAVGKLQTFFTARDILLQIPQRSTLSVSTKSHAGRRMLPILKWMCFHPEILDSQELQNIRLFDTSPTQFHIADERIQTLVKLRRHTAFSQTRRSSSNSIVVMPPRSKLASVVPQIAKINRGQNQKSKYVTYALQAIFCFEYLLLSQYVECIIPLIYVTYISCLRALANSVYYPFLDKNPTDDFTTALENIAWFSSAQIAALSVLHVFFQRRLEYPPLYQLAFVLESEVAIIQTKRLNCVMVVFQFALVHCGTLDDVVDSTRGLIFP